MAFDERIREAEFTSPSGVSIRLYFDAVERSAGKKAPTHEYPQQDRFDVQDLGLQAERFPFACYFTGDVHDKQAKTLREALAEKVTNERPAKLKHPRYGNLDVIAISWNEKEDMVDGVGRTDFSIEFLKVFPRKIFPTTSASLAQRYKVRGENAQANISKAIEDAFPPVDATDVTAVKNQQRTWKDSFIETFSGVIAFSEEVQAQINYTIERFEEKIEEISEDPKAVIDDVISVYNLAADTEQSIKDKVSAFKEQMGDLAEQAVDTLAQAESVIGDILIALAAVIRSTGTGTIKDRGEAVEIADTIDDCVETALTANESAEAAVVEYTADPETIAELKALASIAREDLIQNSFSLRAERRITTQSPRNPIELCYELLGSIDGLDEFIEQNSFTGNELLLIGKGREVVYYA